MDGNRRVGKPILYQGRVVLEVSGIPGEHTANDADKYGQGQKQEKPGDGTEILHRCAGLPVRAQSVALVAQM